MLKRFWQALFVAAFIPPLFYWWQYNSVYLLDSIGWQYSLQAIARLMALAGITLLFMQLPLASRWPYLERAFGQDYLMRIHRKVALYGFFTILFGHIFSLDIAYVGIYGGMSWLTYFLPGWTFKTVGQSAIALFIVIIVVSIYQKRLRLPYHWFKRIHWLAYVALWLGFVHAMNLGGDLFLPGPLRTYFWILFGLAHAIALYRLIYIPIAVRLSPWHVTQVDVVAKDTHAITLTPSKQPFDYLPGQFLFVQFMAKESGITREWHPFTISSSPTEAGHITITPKALGDWTIALGSLPIGSIARIQAPFGRFSYALKAQPNAALVFIAGGIGITPFRSMIKYVADTHSTREVTLLYAATSEEDLAFKTEFDAIAFSHPNIRVTYILDRLTLDIIQKHVPDVSAPDWFVCGPPPMMSAIEAQLREAGVNKRRIHTERFALK